MIHSILFVVASAVVLTFTVHFRIGDGVAPAILVIPAVIGFIGSVAIISAWYQDYKVRSFRLSTRRIYEKNEI